MNKSIDAFCTKFCFNFLLVSTVPCILQMQQFSIFFRLCSKPSEFLLHPSLFFVVRGVEKLSNSFFHVDKLISQKPKTVFHLIAYTFWGTLLLSRQFTTAWDEQNKGLFIWEAGRYVKRDLAMHVYISYFSRSVYMERIFPGRFSSRQTGIPAKAGQFLSYKHSVPLCRDDIMLTSQIAPGRNIFT